ncbi:MAG: PEP-CTERM sorting domain-containing protein [Alphaproteobacteria bacterium]|nr:MAG: PEP-CTERM sorting domain-containing protein [Alphaproteobacteria bacterium]
MNMVTKGLLAATALVTLPSVAQATVVVSNVNISVPNNIDGVYINLVTGATGSSSAVVSGYDLNVYNNGAGLTFYGPASPSGILVAAIATPATLSVALDLAPGTVIGSSGTYNQFQNVGTLFQVAGNHILGFRFQNESTGALNYAYARITTATGTGTSLGFPATITQLVYENSGAALTVAAVGAVPEPTTWAMLIGGFGVLGATMRRRATVTTKATFA